MKRMRNWVGLASAALIVAGCDSSDPIEADPAVAPFVGTWDAVVFTVTGDAPPNQVADVLTFGDFWISVQPSGRYEAVLAFLGGQYDPGQLTVQSSTVLVLDSDRTGPSPSSYTFATPDSLVLDGATEFDFNGDQSDEPATAHIELVRRDP